MSSSLPTVLLTGASGVLGTALLAELPARCRVVALIHRSPCPAAHEQLTGDVTSPGLGLDPSAYRALARKVDAVVHCAAVTEFTGGPDATRTTNEAGTRAVTEFAADAGATLYHVSTAFVARHELTRSRLGRDTGTAGARPEDYLDSKRAGEDVVRSAGLPSVIIRPSIVVGDSRTGDISAFQGLHGILLSLMRGLMPLVPLPPASLIDFVPQDVVARTIAALIAEERREGEVWVTAGPQALRADEVMAAVGTACAELGLNPAMPRFVGPDMVDRLIRPVFLADGLPERTLRRFDDMLAMTALFADAPVFPTSLGEVPGGPAPLTRAAVEAALRSSLHHLARTKRLGTASGRAARGPVPEGVPA
ncbi:ketoreductase [Streptomyces lucensis JCM 4490]|uniref:Ketoreductase n=1 Tax=Streptomyces lucensis JCM 4490 TaxID=1306176 RepID=A0A918JBH2_9ACTN|nr:SDR family oxidoreductase [Streptomyces lucensis]GGW72017.1 ketoreductase [Streptomyces lucensis JCM 4490]